MKKQYMGTCPHCFASIACDEQGRLARHGWREAGGRRRGEYGNTWHTGACSGSLAFELSAIQTWLAVAEAQRQCEYLLETDVSSMKPIDQRGLKHHIQTITNYINEASEKARCWSREPLQDRKVVERQQADKKREQHEAEAAERQAKRDAKAARKAAREQAKAEALVKLEELFKGAEPGTAYSMGQLKKRTGASEGTVYDFVNQVVMASHKSDAPGVYVDWERKNEINEQWKMFNNISYESTGRLMKIAPMSFKQWSNSRWLPDDDGVMRLVEKS